MIKDNLAATQNRILQACQRTGRDPKSVTLIAVSKTKPVWMIEEAIEAGMTHFGENKPQELRDKTAVITADLHWHMIGHLQKNKIKYVIEKACLIHSVDSVELARAISDEAQKRGLIAQILVEINIGGEESKHGLRPEDALQAIRDMSSLPGIHINGLMTVAPIVENPEDSRLYFRALRNLSIDIEREKIDNVSMCELSMGMTGDYEIAVEEGATLVRVGTGIFGERDYSVH